MTWRRCCFTDRKQRGLLIALTYDHWLLVMGEGNLAVSEKPRHGFWCPAVQGRGFVTQGNQRRKQLPRSLKPATGFSRFLAEAAL